MFSSLYPHHDVHLNGCRRFPGRNDNGGGFYWFRKPISRDSVLIDYGFQIIQQVFTSTFPHSIPRITTLQFFWHSSSEYRALSRLELHNFINNIMADLETFTLLPLEMAPDTKAISSTGATNNALNTELAALNALHRSLLGVDTPTGTPPPPVPVNPKRSAQIGKLRESGNTEFRKGNHANAVRMYSLAIEMALGRPSWEPSGLVREEVSGLLSNRAQANMSLQNWAEGAVDAEASVEMKKVGNAKAWWRRGKCLLEMGRLEEAESWVKQALEFEATEPDLVTLKNEIEQKKTRKV
jgi:translocation protein SEC72